MISEDDMKIEIDLNDMDLTVSHICEAALRIGKGAKPGSPPAIMAKHLRDVATPWAKIMHESVTTGVHPPDNVIAIVRTYGFLLAMTLACSVKPGQNEGAIETVLETLKEDIGNVLNRQTQGATAAQDVNNAGLAAFLDRLAEKAKRMKA